MNRPALCKCDRLTDTAWSIGCRRCCVFTAWRFVSKIISKNTKKYYTHTIMHLSAEKCL